MRLLVTGGAGFIGSHVVRLALEQGLEVAVLDDFSTGKVENVPEGVRIFECDLRSREETARVVASFAPQLVSHQAAQVSVAVSVRSPALDAEINVLGGISLLDACTAEGLSPPHLVFASTGGAIYGEVRDGERASEDYGFVPKSPYAVSKLAFEQLLRIYGAERGLRSTVLRYANVYGPRQDPHGEAGVVAIFFARAKAGGPLPIHARLRVGDGGCLRDYVFVADVARANLLAFSAEFVGQTLNLGSGVATSTLELARAVVALTGSASSVEEVGPRPGDIERSLLDPSRAERVFGPATSLAIGLSQTARWYLER